MHNRCRFRCPIFSTSGSLHVLGIDKQLEDFVLKRRLNDPGCAWRSQDHSRLTLTGMRSDTAIPTCGDQTIEHPDCVTRYPTRGE